MCVVCCSLCVVRCVSLVACYALVVCSLLVDCCSLVVVCCFRFRVLYLVRRRVAFLCLFVL